MNQNQKNYLMYYTELNNFLKDFRRAGINKTEFLLQLKKFYEKKEFSNELLDNLNTLLFLEYRELNEKLKYFIAGIMKFFDSSRKSLRLNDSIIEYNKLIEDREVFELRECINNIVVFRTFLASRKIEENIYENITGLIPNKVSGFIRGFSYGFMSAMIRPVEYFINKSYVPKNLLK